MATVDPLSRTASNESSRSHSSTQHLSSPTHSSRKAAVDAAGQQIDRTNASMAPPSKPPVRHLKPADELASRERSSGDQQSSLHRVSIDSSRSQILPPPSTPSEPVVRRSDPEIDTKHMSHTSLVSVAGKSAPSSVAGGYENDILRGSASPPADALQPEGAAGTLEGFGGRATTAEHHLSVTTLSQNGSLSPTLDNSLKELSLASAPNASAAVMSSSAPQIHKDGRTVRGRGAASSRRASNSNPNSSSASAERPAAGEKNPRRIGTIGICALDSKARSKPSRNILNRLVGKDNEFEVIIFGDKVILDEAVENWPVCDFLISFFSEGFPLEKAIAYAKLRRPFCVNDLPMQTCLWDRRICLYILDRLGVPSPGRIEVNRDGGPVLLSAEIAQRMKQLTGVDLQGNDGRGGDQKAPNTIFLEDDDDTLVVGNQKLSKPFVEKPVSGEDHNINIYYPKSQGGGGRRLFRKVNNKSSEKDDSLIIPRAITDPDGSYIYEQFLKVENAEDVKAYTVGPDFCHAETRKSPVVDGVVKRNPNGKEIRYVTSLSKEEQVMAAKIATGFGQRVCGFDLLRVGDQSYVIDVNGWSFVKDNNDYYDKCASILKGMFVREKMRWEGKATTPSEEGDRQLGMPDSSVIEKSAGPLRKQATTTDKERVNHRNALKSVLRSRSISQLREHVSNAAHKVGHPQNARSPSGAASPLSNPPTIERTPSKGRIARPSSSADDMLPPPSMSPHSHLNEEHRVYDHTSMSGSAHEPLDAAPSNIPAPASKSQWKLKSMVAVIRHADRTPKQKFKFTFHTKPFVDLLKGHQEEVLLVGEAALNSVQVAVRQALEEGIEDATKLRMLQNALAKKGSWPGTKVQIKPMFKKPKAEKAESKHKKAMEAKEKAAIDPSHTIPLAGPVEGEEVSLWSKKVGGAPLSITEGDSGGPAQARVQSRSDSIGELTMSRHAAADNNLTLDKLQLVMKWGGEPTHSARYQAADLGENMRNDLLLMNKEVLADVSIFTSSERRVTTSAQIFAGGFLGQKDVDSRQIRVRKDLLDDSNAAKDEMDKVKKKLKGLLRQGNAAPEEFAWPKDGTPEPYVVVRNVVELMKFHRRVMRDNFSNLQTSEAARSLQRVSSPLPIGSETDSTLSANSHDSVSHASSIQARWCTGEDAELFKERWEKLFDEFTDAEKVDPSKISELYDTMKFDALHNRQFLEWVFTPSQNFLLEEASEEDRTVRRTESMSAREEFAHTHDGTAPIPDGNNTSGSDAYRRSETGAVLSSRDRDRASFSQRIGLRRRSVELKAAARNAMAGVNPEDSYFNLYRGSVSAVDSKVRNDVRLEKLNELYGLSKILFDFIGPQEYGITNAEKLEIGLLTSLPLLREIVKDLEEVQASDDAKSFIYFTKESHIYTLLNCILEGGIQTKIARNAIPELDYLSQICFELYESENAEADIDPSNPDSNFNYSIRITISPGCHTFDPLDVQLDSKHCIGCAPRRSLTPHAPWKEVIETLRAKFHTVKLPKSFTAVNLSEKIPQEFADKEVVSTTTECGVESP